MATGRLDGTVKRYLSIWLPHFPVEHLYRKARQTVTSDTLADLDPRIPLSLTASAQGGIRVISRNKAAEKTGVRQGQLLTDAKALCPMMQVFDYDPTGDAQMLERLTLWSIRYSPWVVTDGHDGIMMDITGCAHLLGGEAPFLHDIRTRLFRLGFMTHTAIADTIGTAWAISRFGNSKTNIVPHGENEKALAKLPVDALRIDEKAAERLKKVGLKTVGSLYEKPRSSLAARYGEKLTNLLDQALGQKAESLSPISEPPDYHIHKHFMEPVLLLDQISFSLEKLCASLSDILEKSTLGARRFVLFLYRVDGDVKSLAIRTSSLTNDKKHILRLFNEKLSDLSEQYDAGFGIEQITLGAYFTENVTGHQTTLTGRTENGSPADFKALIDRYGNRLGFNNVGTFSPQESHIPERSEKLIPISEGDKKSEDWSTFLQDLQGGHHLGRPILLLPRPEPITAIAEVPDGPPIHFEWRRIKYRIMRAEGPERLSPEWWQPGSMALEPTRDYFRVEDADGGRFWLFRQGLYERHESTKWFMHGFFA